MKVIFKFLFYVLLLLAPAATYAIPAVPVPAPAEIRRPALDRIEKFKSDKNFVYEKDYTQKIGFWEVFWEWIARHILRPAFSPKSKPFWDVLQYVLAAAAIIFLVFFITRGERVSLFSRGPKGLALDIEGADEDINQMDFEKLVNDAIAKGEYRVAVRYLYLRLLKDLSDNNLIQWKSDKTNRDYVNELRSSVYGTRFREVTLLFDYAWYGDVSINEGRFGQIRTSFYEFYKQLQNRA